MESSELKTIRHEMGLSKEELAARIGLSRETIALMEQGHEPIDQRTAMAVGTLSQGAGMIAGHRARIEKARELLDRIQKRGMRFYSCDGTAPMRDVTEETVAAQHAEIRQAREIIGLWGGTWS